MKQGLIIIKFLPANSNLSAKKSWMITALVDTNKRQYQVLSMHEDLYNNYDNWMTLRSCFQKQITSTRAQSAVLISAASWNSC